MPPDKQEKQAPARDERDLMVDKRIECRDRSPSWWNGRWLDWHRGHGCSKDDGEPVTAEGAAEFLAAGRLPGRAALRAAPTPTPRPDLEEALAQGEKDREALERSHDSQKLPGRIR